MDIRRTILDTVPKELWIDLEDRHRAEAFKAFNVVRSNLPLNAKRSREAEGQIRFRLQEQGFEEVVQQHGGLLLADGFLPGANSRVYQPFARFPGDKVGVVLGFAAMPEPRKLPPRNMSRAAGVSLNFHLQPGLFEDDPRAARADDVFVLFLTARDRQRAGLIEEIAIGVIGADYADYLFYDFLEDFLRGYGESPDAKDDTPEPPADGAAVKLRLVRSPFVPPESRPDSEAEDGTRD